LWVIAVVIGWGDQRWEGNHEFCLTVGRVTSRAGKLARLKALAVVS